MPKIQMTVTIDVANETDAEAARQLVLTALGTATVPKKVSCTYIRWMTE